MYIDNTLVHGNNYYNLINVFCLYNILFLESEPLFYCPLYCTVFVVMKLPVLQKFHQNVLYNSSPHVDSMTYRSH